MPPSGSEQRITVATYGLMPIRRPAGGPTVASHRAEVGGVGVGEGEVRVALARVAGYTTDDEV